MRTWRGLLLGDLIFFITSFSSGTTLNQIVYVVAFLPQFLLWVYSINTPPKSLVVNMNLFLYIVDPCIPIFIL